MAAGTDLVDACLHRGDPSLAHRSALATRRPGGWTELSYAELDRRSRRVAGWLASRGVVAGDRVAILGEAGADWVVALFGVWRRGAVAVPLDAMLGTDELAPIVRRARPAAVISSGAGRTKLPAGMTVLRFDGLAGLPDGPDPDLARRAGDNALIVWTSGTSGAPKGVTLSFANVAYVVEAGRVAHGLDGDDRWLSILPLNHMLEMSCGLLPALATGASFAFAGTTSPRQVASAMNERGCTRMTVVPGFLATLVAALEAEERPGARRATLHCGGAALDTDVARRCGLVGIPVYTGYGLTETAPTVAMNTPAARRHGSVGRPLPGTEVRIADGGEILVRSPAVMVGYWDDDALTSTVVDAEGWFHTGDLGRLDAGGFLYVTGRAKTLIVLPSGKKVQPEEIEQALATSTLLAETCVVAWAPPGGGEEVWAVVVASPCLQARCPNPHALVKAAEEEVARLTAGLAAFKRPAAVRVFAGGLPRTAKRSIRRREVVRLLAAAGAGG